MGDSLGEYFQRAREAKGLTVEEAAARTRILPQFLKAVEENNYARLPDEVFAKGFVRSYARILGLGRSRSSAISPARCHSKESPLTTGRRWSWMSRPSSGAGPRCRPTMPLPRKCC